MLHLLSNTNTVKVVLLFILLLQLFSLYRLTSRQSKSSETAEDQSIVKPTRKLLFVAFFSTVKEIERRALIRAIIKGNYNEEDVAVRFVMGQPHEDWEEEMMLLEQNAHGDIFMIPVKENMEDGKTFAFYEHLYRLNQKGVEPRYDFVLKTDLDSFVHIGNFAKRVTELDSTKNIYLGHRYPSFGIWYMVGMGYTISWNLLDLIVHSEYAVNHVKGFEDAQTGFWIEDLRKNGVDIVEVDEPMRIHNHPKAPPIALMHGPITEDCMLIHYLKDTKQYLEVAEFFYPDKFNDPVELETEFSEDAAIE